MRLISCGGMHDFIQQPGGAVEQQLSWLQQKFLGYFKVEAPNSKDLKKNIHGSGDASRGFKAPGVRKCWSQQGRLSQLWAT